MKVDVRERGAVSIDPAGRPAERVSYLEEGERKFVAGQVSPSEMALWWLDEGAAERRAVVSVASGETITAVRVGRTGTAIAGTDRGEGVSLAAGGRGDAHRRVARQRLRRSRRWST